MSKPIAIQGIKGSFHHQVVRHCFGDNSPVYECMSFDAVIEKLLKGQSDIAVMAIENSIAGSIIPNYALIDEHHLHITGEYYLEIEHQLMALPQQQIQDIEEVHSHPMALLQCKTFLRQFPHIKRIETGDTAEVARAITTNRLQGIAAIASRDAAEYYQLNILAENIQTIKHNETRFVLVEQPGQGQSDPQVNKASLKFSLNHKRGSLAAVLNVMSDCKLSLTKIQSLPIIEVPWKYAFFVDVTFNDYEDYSKAKSILELMADNFKVLGEYKNLRL
jgi:prephenate dehydratase